MKSLDPLRAKRTFIRKKLGHTAVLSPYKIYSSGVFGGFYHYYFEHFVYMSYTCCLCCERKTFRVKNIIAFHVPAA